MTNETQMVETNETQNVAVIDLKELTPPAKPSAGEQIVGLMAEAVLEKIQAGLLGGKTEFLLGMVTGAVEAALDERLSDAVGETIANDDLIGAFLGSNRGARVLESACEDAVNDKVESAIGDYDFTDIVDGIMDNHDFSDEIESALDDRDFSSDIESALGDHDFSEEIKAEVTAQLDSRASEPVKFDLDALKAEIRAEMTQVVKQTLVELFSQAVGAVKPSEVK